MFFPSYIDGSKSNAAVGKVVCVGRNYAEHARELNNPIPSKPLLFLKPATAVVALNEPFSIPKQMGAVHHEVELALLIGSSLSQSSPMTCMQSIVGIGLALDLTLRDIQDELKSGEQPWDIAKGFDGSCPLSEFIAIKGIDATFETTFSLNRNGKTQQQGNTKDMIFSIGELLSNMSRYFTLEPGDVVLTGTPKGVGPLISGDKLILKLGSNLNVETQVL